MKKFLMISLLSGIAATVTAQTEPPADEIRKDRARCIVLPKSDFQPEEFVLLGKRKHQHAMDEHLSVRENLCLRFGCRTLQRYAVDYQSFSRLCIERRQFHGVHWSQAERKLGHQIKCPDRKQQYESE
jgi:hypothetical protein